MRRVGRHVSRFSETLAFVSAFALTDLTASCEVIQRSACSVLGPLVVNGAKTPAQNLYARSPDRGKRSGVFFNRKVSKLRG